MQFLAGSNLLTGRTDSHWAAVRKGIAPAFSIAKMRSFPECTESIIAHAFGAFDTPCGVQDGS